ADDDREDVAGAEFGDLCFGRAEPLVEGEPLGGVDEVDEVVGDALALGEGGLGGADVHAFVDLIGVGGDDLGSDPVLLVDQVGEGDGRGGLAAGGRAADHGESGGQEHG